MKNWVQSPGYTIIEVLIFLAVSGALMASALALMNGQQQRTEFTQAVRDFDSRMRDIINDVSTGFYPNSGDINCTYDPTAGKPDSANGIQFLPGAPREQGANSDCAFIGRVIQFAPEGLGANSIRVYTVAGQRQVGVGREPESLRESKARLVAAAGTTDITPNAFEEFTHSSIMHVGKVCYKGCNPNEELGGIGILSTFGSYSGNSLQSGTTSAELVPLSVPPPGSSQLGRTQFDFVAGINSKLKGSSAWSESQYRQHVADTAESGVVICLLSQGYEQHAIIKIGGGSSQLTTDVSFHAGNDVSDC